MYVVDLVIDSSATAFFVLVQHPVRVDAVVVIESVDVNVGVPVAVPSVATGQLGAVHTGPVTVALRLILLEVPVWRVAVTVAVALRVWTIVALDGLTARL